MDTFAANIDKLAVKPPITSNSIRHFDPAVVEHDADGTRIVVHSHFPQLVQAFLEHKRTHGSKTERQFYSSSTTKTWQDEIARLIAKRPLVFMGSSDFTVLRDGSEVRGDATTKWDSVGSDREGRQLQLDEYLSYDEIMLGSLIGVSGHSYFINDGSRFNQGKSGAPGTFEHRGIIIGLVGARYERDDRMDSIFVLPPVEKPKMHPELRQTFMDFFGRLGSESIGRATARSFDVATYKARMRITIDILLLEADSRAKEAARKAHTYVVGLGLGVWQHGQRQAEYYIDSFVAALNDLSLARVGTLEFAYIPVPDSVQAKVKKAAGRQGIKVLFSQRNPAEKLETDELLVLSYAWDGNAFPGNEYWIGSLCASGDPAAACMSTIGELHNPLVNPGFLERIQVCGEE